MEDNNLEFPFVFPKESKPVISIIGIGGGAGRIVNKIQTCKLTDTELSVFGMNRKEMEELSLPHKYLIGADGKYCQVWRNLLPIKYCPAL